MPLTLDWVSLLSAFGAKDSGHQHTAAPGRCLRPSGGRRTVSDRITPCVQLSGFRAAEQPWARQALCFRFRVTFPSQPFPLDRADLRGLQTPCVLSADLGWSLERVGLLGGVADSPSPGPALS